MSNFNQNPPSYKDGDTTPYSERVTIANSLVQVPYDYISLTQATTTDTWVFKNGGAAGATVATVTITYTDVSKSVISTVAKV